MAEICAVWCEDVVSKGSQVAVRISTRPYTTTTTHLLLGPRLHLVEQLDRVRCRDQGLPSLLPHAASGWAVHRRALERQLVDQRHRLLRRAVLRFDHLGRLLCLALLIAGRVDQPRDLEHALLMYPSKYLGAFGSIGASAVHHHAILLGVR